MKFQDDFSSMEKEFPSCCAQPQQSQSYTCRSPRPLTTVIPDGSIIDLTSPKAEDFFQWNREQTCYSPRNKDKNFSMQNKSHGSSIDLSPRAKASPDVQILGGKSLQDNCLTMLGNLDEHYNTRLLLGSTSSSRGKENVPPKRIVQPRKYLCSPYDNQDRGSIMSHELVLYDNIMTLSAHPDFKGRWVVEIDNCRVSL